MIANTYLTNWVSYGLSLTCVSLQLEPLCKKADEQNFKQVQSCES